MSLIRSDGRESHCVIFLEKQVIFFGGVEASTVVRQCHVSKTGRPGSLIPKVLMWWSHAAMDLSYWPHMVRLMFVNLR